MRKKNTLSKRQLDVIDDLFAGEFDEQTVLKKYNVNARLYSKWQAEDAFIDEFEKRIAAAHRQSAAVIAGYAPIAAARLVQLTQSEKPETARRACLDIISMQRPPKSRPAPKPPVASPKTSDQAPQLNPQTASRILAILADELDEQEHH